MFVSNTYSDHKRSKYAHLTYSLALHRVVFVSPLGQQS